MSYLFDDLFKIRNADRGGGKREDSCGHCRNMGIVEFI